jgi:hypothetical protein
MRKVLMLGLLAAVATTLGCATVTMTAEENMLQTQRIVELETRQIGDDWNLIWLNDRASRLTKWHSR